jgi:hypothetical protein
LIAHGAAQGLGKRCVRAKKKRRKDKGVKKKRRVYIMGMSKIRGVIGGDVRE